MTDIQAIADSGPAVETALTYTTNTGERVVYQITEASEDEDNPEIRKRYAVHHMPVHDVRAVADGLAPSWYGRLRKPLSVVVLVSLGVVLMVVARASLGPDSAA